MHAIDDTCTTDGPMRCVSEAWNKHEAELHRFLRHRCGDAAVADDLLQEVFLRALRRQDGLCGIDSPRAWLFHAARNLLIDRLRLAKEQLPLPDDLADEAARPTAAAEAGDAGEAAEEAPPVERLTQCLPRVLSELSPLDREAITLCDLEGMTQLEYARLHGISLPAAKSRVQRARLRLRARLIAACRVRFGANGEVAGFVPRPPLP